MAHNRDAPLHELPHRLSHPLSTFELNGLSSSLLDEAGSITQGLSSVGVGHEGHITHYHGPFRPPDNCLGVVYHLLHGYRDGGFIAQHYHTQTISYQDEGNPRFIY